MARSVPVPFPSNAALLLIDLQSAIDHPDWGQRNNPDAEKNVAALLAAWRISHRPVYHIRHDSTDPASHYRPGQPGHEFKPEARPIEGESVVAKRTNNAFIGTNLEATLRAGGHSVLVVAGVITNNSVEATVRMAGNLGFDTFLVEDACFTFARRDWNGQLRSADEVHAMSLANLDREYATVTKTAEVLAALGERTSSTVENLILDLLEWVAARERTYDEVMAAWRTSCPRLPVWEDTCDRGLVAIEQDIVRLTRLGEAHLARIRPLSAQPKTA